MNKKVFTWKCPKCGKVISSLYERQFNYNKKQHEEKEQKKVS